MNFKEAKQLPITDYLTRHGIRPQSVQGNQVWYCSPLRSEKTPSFKVDTKRNLWYDHGAGQGGTIIDLMQALGGITANEALQQLNQGSESFSFQQQPLTVAERPHRELTIKSVKLLGNPALIRYAEGRAIPYSIARAYLSECYYSIEGKNYFGLGFANDQGGYELRNALWQGASAPKAITTLPVAGSTTVSVFEGFFDMLSALVYFEKTKPAHTVLVLNSVALLDTALPALSQYERVHLFLDNDQAGRKAAEVIKGTCPQVADYSQSIFPNHKDFNELVTTRTT